MEGEKKKAGSAGGTQKKKKVNATPIQEYDFFVMRDGGETDETVPADHSLKEKKSSRKKSTSFFLSD
jgi:hypothetical protein